MTRALLRDASWYATPETRRPKSYHAEAEGRRGVSRCNRLLPLAEATAIPAEKVPVELRCRRRGCREAWPATRPRVSPLEPGAPSLSSVLGVPEEVLARVNATLRATR